MDVPNDPELVAWYDFTPKPGLGGNAVFSGHVDWRNYGPAVFWDLDELSPGDDIEVVLADGTTIVYRVSATQTYDLENLNMGEILAATPVESVTLITCEGSFSNGEYDSRRVVRAVRTAVLDGDT
jgi:LPXTG-site transpeptidase (sortase) family protein